MNKIKLFCLPYAGGSAVIFYKWKPYLNHEIELVPMELAGRGSRIHEDLYGHRSDAVKDVYEKIKHQIEEGPYMLFGHSLGAMITYELAQMIRDKGLPAPLHVFVSASSAPHLRYYNKKYHLLDEATFKEEIINLGGTPPEFFEHPELMELFLPMLKNDFKIAETALDINSIVPLDENLTVFLGKDDDLTLEQCVEWEKYTNGSCQLHYFEGGHFFLHENTQKVVEQINATYLKDTRQLQKLNI